MSTYSEIRKWRRTGLYQYRRRLFMWGHPLCAVCDRDGIIMAGLELDHIVPVSERPDLFWDEGNWQSLCRDCHEAKTARENAARGGPAAAKVAAKRAAWSRRLGELS